MEPRPGEDDPDGPVTEPSPVEPTWIGTDPKAADQPGVRPVGVRRRARSGAVASPLRWLVIVVGIVGVWLIVVLAGRAVSTEDRTRESESDSTTFPDTADGGSAGDLSGGIGGEGQGPNSSDTSGPSASTEDLGVTQLGSRTESAVQIDTMVRQFERRDATAALAYWSNEGVVVVDLARGATAVIEPSNGAAVAPRFVGDRSGNDYTLDDLGVVPTDVILRAAGFSFAIDPDTLETSLVGDDGSLVVTDSLGPTVHWVAGRDRKVQSSEVLALRGDRSWWMLAPVGVQLVGFDGFGFAAVSYDSPGTTWVPRAEQFELFTDGRVFDANAAGMLVERCGPVPESASREAADRPDCDLVVEPFGDGDPWVVPASALDLGDRLLLAPDARAVLRLTTGGLAEILLADGGIAWVTGASMEHGRWGSDSSFVAWIDLLGEPEVRVMFVDRRDWFVIDLKKLGLPRPLGTDIVVFDRPPVEEPSG